MPSDEQVFTAQAQFAREEGILAEPGGAVVLADTLASLGSRRIADDLSVICLLTNTVGLNNGSAIDKADGIAALLSGREPTTPDKR